jgi:hypothetical protein
MLRASKSARSKAVAALVVGSVMITGYLESCDNRLVGLTRYIDPCTTFLANCAPGEFLSNRANIGDYCIDPACTVPGGCGTGLQPLGTVRNICP